MKIRKTFVVAVLPLLFSIKLQTIWSLDGYEGSEINKRVKAKRKELAASYSAFSLIQDIADATKHAKLHRENATLSCGHQIAKSPGIFGTPFGEGVFAEAVIVYATLNDGTIKPIEPAIRAVTEMLERLLAEATE